MVRDQHWLTSRSVLSPHTCARSKLKVYTVAVGQLIPFAAAIRIGPACNPDGSTQSNETRQEWEVLIVHARNCKSLSRYQTITGCRLNMFDQCIQTLRLRLDRARDIFPECVVLSASVAAQLSFSCARIFCSVFYLEVRTTVSPYTSPTESLTVPAFPPLPPCL